MLGSFIFAELLAFLGVLGDVGEGSDNGSRTNMLNPYYLHFDALLTLFWSSSGRNYKFLNWLRDSGPISRMIASFGLDLVLELPPVSYCGIPKIQILYVHSCC
jgi:hypothetical protein